MRTWIVNHPYAITSLVFLLVALAGDRLLNWPAEYFSFMLLLYFIVTLGIRLDNISKQIGVTNDRLAKIATDSDQVSDQLNEIQSSLSTLTETLSSLSPPETRKN